MKKIQEKEKYFTFPDIPGILYPVQAESESGKTYNFKSSICPGKGGSRRYSRGKQLGHRSQQAKMFDAIINIGYFDPLPVWREFPVVIKNSLRLPGQSGSYIMCDYYFPTLRMAVELDSEYHDGKEKQDALRDEYLEKNYGIVTRRLRDLWKPAVQKKDFRELTRFMRERGEMKPVEWNY